MSSETLHQTAHTAVRCCAGKLPCAAAWCYSSVLFIFVFAWPGCRSQKKLPGPSFSLLQSMSGAISLRSQTHCQCDLTWWPSFEWCARLSNVAGPDCRSRSFAGEALRGHGCGLRSRRVFSCPTGSCSFACTSDLLTSCGPVVAVTS